MEKKLVVIMGLIFVMGFASASMFAYIQNSNFEVQMPIERTQIENNVQSSSDILFDDTLQTKEKPSPKERVLQKNISVFQNEVVLKIENPQWAIFTNSNSMDPVLDTESKAIEVIPKEDSSIQVGDIAAYESKIKKATIIHRIVFIGRDSLGWYALMKGDNNAYNDPERVRFEQVKRVVVAIIY